MPGKGLVRLIVVNQPTQVTEHVKTDNNRLIERTMNHKMTILTIGLLAITLLNACGSRATAVATPSGESHPIARQNLIRSMELTDDALSAYITPKGMARFYNPFTGERSEEKGSVWMYTSAIEAVNAILHGLKTEKEVGNGELYDLRFDHYKDILIDLYENADYYLGTFTLTSYTRTAEWTVYGVHRGAEKGAAKVAGIENVYDDQMWLVREFLEAYRLTGENRFLERAEYLTEYVLDGWDCTLDEDGNERGGITWGPGYVSKHSCSNGPMVSPLVWLHEIYKDRDDQVTHYYIDPVDHKRRKTVQRKKSDYYLEFAAKVYAWQKKHLLRPDGVYHDMMGGCTPGKPELESIGGISYRKGITCRDAVGTAYSYNSGTMLSGAADLYRATGDPRYLEDGTLLSEASFTYFAMKDEERPGYYSYRLNGFNNWFNGVLMRGYVDLFPAFRGVEPYIQTFQQNLDYGFDHFREQGILPTNLLMGWEEEQNKNSTEGMFSFTFAAEYALLSRYAFIR